MHDATTKQQSLGGGMKIVWFCKCTFEAHTIDPLAQFPIFAMNGIHMHSTYLHARRILFI